MLKHKLKHRELIKLKQHENTSVFYSSDNGAATYAKTQAKTQGAYFWNKLQGTKIFQYCTCPAG